jgi:hypothetical protein
MKTAKRDLDWESRWEERGSAVKSVLGETVPPGTVTAFNWKDYKLPGACSLTFGPNETRRSFLSITLGMTQPLYNTKSDVRFEFSVETAVRDNWSTDLLYQLVTQWLCEKGNMGLGYSLPLRFFRDKGGQMWSTVADDISGLDLIGTMRTLYLWHCQEKYIFSTSSGDFGLLKVVGLTQEEEAAASRTSPAHLMLLFRRLGIDQLCDPFRESVFSRPSASRAWESIETLDDDRAFHELQSII